MATTDNDRLAGYQVLSGQFGTIRPEVKLAFPYFGETIRVHPYASDIEWTAFIDSMKDVPAEQVNDMAVLDETMKYVRGQIHPDDWDLFYRTATANHQNSVDLVALAQDIVSVVAGFPTGRPSDSPDGPQLTGHLSKGGSPRPARQRGKKSGKQKRKDAQRRVMATQADRPDLALNTLEVYEATIGSQVDIVDGQVVLVTDSGAHGSPTG